MVESLEEAAAAVERLDDFDRAACRRVFEERFSVERMARDYVGVYEQLAEAVTLPAVHVKEATPWKTLFASKTITTS